LADGRLLGFAEYGVADGPAIVFCHGEVGSRLQGRSLHAAGRDRGVRIVSPDRPGLGFSDFRPGRTVAEWPADVAELADQLGIDRFAVVSAAAGAGYALACAWKLPERVAATILAGPVLAVPMVAPVPGTPLPQRLLTESAVKAPWTIRIAMTGLELLSRRSPDQAVGRMAGSAGEADRELFNRPEVRAMLAASLAETFRSGARGVAYDLHLTTAEWGLPFGSITAPVSVWRGEGDTEVALADVRGLVAALPHGQLHEVAGRGHHLVLAEPEALLDGLLDGLVGGS
jgi:pimeloyl-ACP methyl ester carboxylesterase